MKEQLGREQNEVDKILIDRAHRVGKNKKRNGARNGARNGSARPIVAEFHNYQNRETVSTLPFEKAETLKNKGRLHRSAVAAKKKVKPTGS